MPCYALASKTIRSEKKRVARWEYQQERKKAEHDRHCWKKEMEQLKMPDFPDKDIPVFSPTDAWVQNIKICEVGLIRREDGTIVGICGSFKGFGEEHP